jgi:hypothetical protein
VEFTGAVDGAELNGDEGAGPLGWGAALGFGEALGPAYRERGGVRCLGTDEVAENRGEARSWWLTGGRQRWGVDKRTGGVFFYNRAVRGGNAGLCKVGEREVTASHGGRATGVHTRNKAQQ